MEGCVARRRTGAMVWTAGKRKPVHVRSAAGSVARGLPMGRPKPGSTQRRQLSTGASPPALDRFETPACPRASSRRSGRHGVLDFAGAPPVGNGPTTPVYLTPGAAGLGGGGGHGTSSTRRRGDTGRAYPCLRAPVLKHDAGLPYPGAAGLGGSGGHGTSSTRRRGDTGRAYPCLRAPVLKLDPCPPSPPPLSRHK
jgi:hypothetical protein